MIMYLNIKNTNIQMYMNYDILRFGYTWSNIKKMFQPDLIS